MVIETDIVPNFIQLMEQWEKWLTENLNILIHAGCFRMHRGEASNAAREKEDFRGKVVCVYDEP